MKPWLKKSLVSLAVLLLVFAGCWLAWPMLPIPLRVRIIRADYSMTDNWYPTYNRLGDMLKLGMTTSEVRDVLGTPDIKKTVPGGERWEYDEVGATSGGGCVVDFAPDGDTLRLHYFLNFEHVVFRDSPHREFGSPVDGGKFESDPALGLRWHEWHGERPDTSEPTQAAPRRTR